MALVPLSLWFAGSLISLTRMHRTEVVLWIGNRLSASLLILFVAIGFYHAQLGLRVVIEDYVHAERFKIVLVTLVKFAAAIFAVASIFAVLKIVDESTWQNLIQ